MSGIVGHMMYAILAHRAARDRLPEMARIVDEHYGSYLAGAYLGCDIQTLPEAICVDTGKEVGYGTAPLERSPMTGGPVRPWTLSFAGAKYRPTGIHQLFYGRAHVVFGWHGKDRSLAVPWDDLPDYAADVVQDAATLFGPGDRPVAYVLGWLAHVVGDSLIKSIQPGVELHLLDGKYTRRNRPIQDLVTFHEVGRKELQLDWTQLMTDLVNAPIEPIQAHYMRVAARQGQLAAQFPDGWIPRQQALLLHVFSENRRYLRVRFPRIVKQLALTSEDGQLQCGAELSRLTGGLSYPEMVKLARQARFRRALDQISDAIVSLLEQVQRRREKWRAK